MRINGKIAFSQEKVGLCKPRQFCRGVPYVASQSHYLQQNSSPPSTCQAALSSPSPQMPRWTPEGHLHLAGSLLPQDQCAPKQSPSPLLHALACSGSITCVIAASGGSLSHLCNHFAVRFTFQNTNLASEIFNGPPLLVRPKSTDLLWSFQPHLPAFFATCSSLLGGPHYGQSHLLHFFFFLCCYLLHSAHTPALRFCPGYHKSITK